MSYALSAVLFRLGFSNLWRAPVYNYSAISSLYLYFKALFWNHKFILLTYKIIKHNLRVYVYFYYYRYKIFDKEKKKKSYFKDPFFLKLPSISFYSVKFKLFRWLVDRKKTYFTNWFKVILRPKIFFKRRKGYRSWLRKKKLMIAARKKFKRRRRKIAKRKESKRKPMKAGRKKFKPGRRKIAKRKEPKRKPMKAGRKKFKRRRRKITKRKEPKRKPVKKARLRRKKRRRFRWPRRLRKLYVIKNYNFKEKFYTKLTEPLKKINALQKKISRVEAEVRAARIMLKKKISVPLLKIGLRKLVSQHILGPSTKNYLLNKLVRRLKALYLITPKRVKKFLTLTSLRKIGVEKVWGLKSFRRFQKILTRQIKKKINAQALVQKLGVSKKAATAVPISVFYLLEKFFFRKYFGMLSGIYSPALKTVSTLLFKKLINRGFFNKVCLQKFHKKKNKIILKPKKNCRKSKAFLITLKARHKTILKLKYALFLWKLRFFRLHTKGRALSRLKKKLGRKVPKTKRKLFRKKKFFLQKIQKKYYKKKLNLTHYFTLPYSKLFTGCIQKNVIKKNLKYSMLVGQYMLLRRFRYLIEKWRIRVKKFMRLRSLKSWNKKVGKVHLLLGFHKGLRKTKKLMTKAITGWLSRDKFLSKYRPLLFRLKKNRGVSRGKIKGRGEIFIKNGADLVKINKKAQILRIKKKKFRIFRRLIKKNLPAYLSKQWFLNKNFWKLQKFNFYGHTSKHKVGFSFKGVVLNKNFLGNKFSFRHKSDQYLVNKNFYNRPPRDKKNTVGYKYKSLMPQKGSFGKQSNFSQQKNFFMYQKGTKKFDGNLKKNFWNKQFFTKDSVKKDVVSADVLSKILTSPQNKVHQAADTHKIGGRAPNNGVNKNLNVKQFSASRPGERGLGKKFLVKGGLKNSNRRYFSILSTTGVAASKKKKSKKIEGRSQILPDPSKNTIKFAAKIKKIAKDQKVGGVALLKKVAGLERKLSVTKKQINKKRQKIILSRVNFFTKFTKRLRRSSLTHKLYKHKIQYLLRSKFLFKRKVFLKKLVLQHLKVVRKVSKPQKAEVKRFLKSNAKVHLKKSKTLVKGLKKKIKKDRTVKGKLLLKKKFVTKPFRCRSKIFGFTEKIKKKLKQKKRFKVDKQFNLLLKKINTKLKKCARLGKKTRSFIEANLRLKKKKLLTHKLQQFYDNRLKKIFWRSGVGGARNALMQRCTKLIQQVGVQHSKKKFRIKRVKKKYLQEDYLYDYFNTLKRLQFKFRKPLLKITLAVLKTNFIRLLKSDISRTNKLQQGGILWPVKVVYQWKKFFFLRKLLVIKKKNWWRRKYFYMYRFLKVKKKKLPFSFIKLFCAASLNFLWGFDFLNYNFKFRNMSYFNELIGIIVRRLDVFYWFLSKPITSFFYTTLVIAKLLNSAYFLNFGLHKIFLNVKLHYFILRNFLMLWKSFLFRKSGIRLLIAGKWFGKMRAKKKLLTFGITRRQTINVFTDYHNTAVITKYGIFSLKLWIGDITL